MKQSLLLLGLLSLPGWAQNTAAPDPIQISAKTQNPLPQADPATIAFALTAAPKTPQPLSIQWEDWMKYPAGVQVQTGIVTGTADGQPLHAEIAWPQNPPPGLMPAIIWVHGGAWVGGTEHPNKAVFFAAHGYFTASIEYRLAPKSKWPAQIQDCKLAVRWLRANAATYHVDPNHIGCWGESAGGHLVSCMGTLDDPAFEGDGGYPGISSKVQAVCDWNGPVDLRKGGPGGNLFTQNYDQNPSIHIGASPIVHIKPDQPPFLVAQGDRDSAVPYKDSVDFVAAMLKAGASVEFISVQGADHGFNPRRDTPHPDPSMPQLLGRMAEFFDKYLKPGQNRD